MKRYLIPILITILVLTSGVLAGCGQGSSSNSLKIYTNYTYGYSVKHPSSWKVDELGETVRIYSSFRGYVSIGVLEGKQLTAEDLKWLVENMDEEFRTEIDDFRLISKRQLYDRGAPAWEIVYTGKTNEGFNFKAIVHIMGYRDKVYVVTALAPGSKLTSDLDGVLNSFRFQ